MWVPIQNLLQLRKAALSVVSRTANLINIALSRKLKSGPEVSRFPFCVISVDAQLQICSSRQAPLMVLDVSLQMRGHPERAAAESSQRVLRIKIPEAETEAQVRRPESREAATARLPARPAPASSLWFKEGWVSGNSSLLPSLSLGPLGLWSRLQERVLIFLVGVLGQVLENTPSH